MFGVSKLVKKEDSSTRSQNNVISDKPLSEDAEVLDTERPLIKDVENSKSQNLNDAEHSILTNTLSKEIELPVLIKKRNRVPSQRIPMQRRPLFFEKNQHQHIKVEIDN